MQKRWGQSVVIENKPGASGNIGTQQVARAAPDGHTLLMAANTFVMNACLFKSVPYDPQTELRARSSEVATRFDRARGPSLGGGDQRSRADSRTTKARPGQINYASPGRGTPQHLTMELFKLTTGVSLKHVPYSRLGPCRADLVGGHVSAMFLPLHTALPLVDGQADPAAGRRRKRSASALAPDVPTLAEQGVTGVDVDFWLGMLAPAGTVPESVARYNAVLNDILRAPRSPEAVSAQGFVAVGGDGERLRAA